MEFLGIDIGTSFPSSLLSSAITASSFFWFIRSRFSIRCLAALTAPSPIRISPAISEIAFRRKHCASALQKGRMALFHFRFKQSTKGTCFFCRLLVELLMGGRVASGSRSFVILAFAVSDNIMANLAEPLVSFGVSFQTLVREKRV